jgi:hypothetical protein
MDFFESIPSVSDGDNDKQNDNTKKQEDSEDNEHISNDKTNTSYNEEFIQRTNDKGELMSHIFLIAGKPESGKTFLLRFLLSQLFNKHALAFGIMFSPMERYATDKLGILPDNCIIEGLTTNKILWYHNELKQKKKRNNDYIPPNFILFDDVLGIIDMTSKKILNFFSTFRHTNTYIFFLAQFTSKGLGRYLPSYTGHMFSFGYDDQGALESIYNSFGQEFTRGEFNEFMNVNTKERYTCVAMIARHPKYGKVWFRFKAPDVTIEPVTFHMPSRIISKLNQPDIDLKEENKDTKKSDTEDSNRDPDV